MTPDQWERKKAYQREYYRIHKKDKKTEASPAEASGAAQPTPGAVRGEARPRDPGPLTNLILKNTAQPPPGDPGPGPVHLHLPPTPDFSKEFEKIEKVLQEVHVDLKEIVTIMKAMLQKQGGMVINSARKQ